MINKKGSVLLFTLLILSLLTILTQQLVRNVLIGSNFTNRIVAMEKAQMLALGGVNLAISQLTKRVLTEKEERRLNEKDTPEKAFQRFLLKVLPNLNRWQTFDLEEKFDGMRGQVKICITCENGKININEAFDFQKNEFKEKYKLLLQNLFIKGKLAEGEILKVLTEFFKTRKKKLDDVTELLEVPGLENVTDLFYKPPKMPESKKNAEPNSDICLQDLFTTWSADDKIELLFFSDSMDAVIGLRRPLANDAQKLKEKFKTLIEAFKKDWGADWEKNWTNLQPIYGPISPHVKSYKDILSKEFGPGVYSVLSCGTAEGVEQKLLAVIKEVEKDDKEQQKNKTPEQNKKEQEGKSSKKYFKILRLYWL